MNKKEHRDLLDYRISNYYKYNPTIKDNKVKIYLDELYKVLDDEDEFNILYNKYQIELEIYDLLCKQCAIISKNEYVMYDNWVRNLL